MRKTFTTQILSALAISTSALAISLPAFAQESERANDNMLDTIVVTAQKRAQNLQDVPIAISAIDSDKVDKLGITDSRDLSGMAPNVTVVQGTTNGTAAVISMRGISNGGQESFSTDSASGLYVDGVYISRSGAAGLDVSEIERVEVLRGPQGTLFGRNTTGGAIHFISRAPSKDFRLKAEAGYGNFNAWNGKISVDPGEILGISTSFTYSHRRRDGVVDNLLESRDSRDPGARKTDSFRGALKADIGGTGSIQYIFDWTKVNMVPNAFQLTHVSDGTVRPISVDGQELKVAQPTPLQDYLDTVTFNDPECADLATPRRAYRDTICNNGNAFAVDQIWGHNLQLVNDFDAFAVKLTTGYRIWHSDGAADLDGMGGFNDGTGNSIENLYLTKHNRRHSQLSQEIEISGDSDNFDWVVGGFYFWEKGFESNPMNFTFYRPGVGAFPAMDNPTYTARSESKAIYGQGTYYLGGRDSGLRLTAGARQTWDSRAISVETSDASGPTAPVLGAADYSKLTWNAMLGYDIADGISAYARAATGYRSGGFNSADELVDGRITPFGQETVTSYEVGLKTELFQRRVRFNLAGYHNEYKDLAVNVPIANAGDQSGYQTRIQNAGRVNYSGFEAELQAILTDNFSIDGSVGYVHVNYKEFVGGEPLASGQSAIDIASIVSPSYTSPWTGNFAVNAQFPVGNGDARLVGRIGYTHEDGKYSFVSSLAAPNNEELRGDARDIIDAQFGIDRIAIGSAEGEIRIWGKNLTNSKDFTRAVDFGGLGFAGGYYADPRTYGVTLSVKY